jgi:hypothetical protein
LREHAPQELELLDAESTLFPNYMCQAFIEDLFIGGDLSLWEDAEVATWALGAIGLRRVARSACDGMELGNSTDPVFRFLGSRQRCRGGQP